MVATVRDETPGPKLARSISRVGQGAFGIELEHSHPATPEIRKAWIRV